MAFLLPYFIFLSFPLLILAQCSNKITTGSSLTAGVNPTSFWASPSKDFAFGFREIEPERFLLAIWLDGALHEKTVTWSANRDHLVPKGSKVELTMGNELVLADPTGQEIWRAQADDVQVGYGEMLNTGNLVLAEISPTQVPDASLYFDKSNSSWRFIIRSAKDGNLGLCTEDFLMYNSTNTLYLSSESLDSGDHGLFNQTRLLYLVAKTRSVESDMFKDDAQNEEFYHSVINEFNLSNLSLSLALLFHLSMFVSRKTLCICGLLIIVTKLLGV